MSPEQYVSYWKLFDSEEYPACLRKALNEYDLPNFWEDIYELSIGAYGDDRAVHKCLARLDEYRTENPVWRFAHSVKRCNAICWDIIRQLGWDFQRAGGVL